MREDGIRAAVKSGHGDILRHTDAVNFELLDEGDRHNIAGTHDSLRHGNTPRREIIRERDRLFAPEIAVAVLVRGESGAFHRKPPPDQAFLRIRCPLRPRQAENAPVAVLVDEMLGNFADAVRLLGAHRGEQPVLEIRADAGKGDIPQPVQDPPRHCRVVEFSTRKDEPVEPDLRDELVDILLAADIGGLHRLALRIGGAGKHDDIIAVGLKLTADPVEIEGVERFGNSRHDDTDPAACPVLHREYLRICFHSDYSIFSRPLQEICRKKTKPHTPKPGVRSREDNMKKRGEA